MDTKFNQDLLWKKIFLYTNYRNLSKEHKVFVDTLFADILSVTSKKTEQIILIIPLRFIHLKSMILIL